MIDWLGARRAADIILLMTLALLEVGVAVDALDLSLSESPFHARF